MSTEGEDKLERVVAIRRAHRGVSTNVIFRVVISGDLQILACLIQSKEKFLEKLDEDVLTQAKIQNIEGAFEETTTITLRSPIQCVS